MINYNNAKHCSTQFFFILVTQIFWTSTWQIKIDCGLRCCEHADADGKHYHEGYDILNNFLYDSDETCCLVEEPHPVEEF